MYYITAEINDVDREIDNLIFSDPDYENAIQSLMTIPGVKRDSAITIISEIGIDMSQFCSSKLLCCWSGLVPGSNESGGKKRAIVAIARMILTAIYQMLSTGEAWNPSDLYKIDMSEALAGKRKAKGIKQALNLLESEGLYPPPKKPLAS